MSIKYTTRVMILFALMSLLTALVYELLDFLHRPACCFVHLYYAFMDFAEV